MIVFKLHYIEGQTYGFVKEPMSYGQGKTSKRHNQSCYKAPAIFHCFSLLHCHPCVQSLEGVRFKSLQALTTPPTLHTSVSQFSLMFSSKSCLHTFSMVLGKLNLAVVNPEIKMLIQTLSQTSLLAEH